MKYFKWAVYLIICTAISKATYGWGIDNIVSIIGPTSQHGLAAKQNGVLYIANPSVDLTGQYSVNFYTSIDYGDSWNLLTFTTTPSLSPIIRLKMIVTSQDSIICTYLQNDIIHFVNIESGVTGQFNQTGAQEYDAASGSGNFIYLFVQEPASNNIRRYGTVDGGLTWTGNTALVTGTGYRPRVDFSGTNLVLNYYGTLAADTVSSVIRAAFYVETAPGTITPGTFQDVSLNTGVKRRQFQSVKNNNVIWYLFTEGDTQQQLKCRVSTDDGASYQPEFVIAGDANVNAYWFSAHRYNFSTSGMTLTYLQDSLVSLTMDLMKYVTFDITAPGTVQIPPTPLDTYNDTEPSVQSNIYPVIYNYQNASGWETGVAWTVPTAIDYALFFDHLNATTGLNDNIDNNLISVYPNPVNDKITISGIDVSLLKGNFNIYNSIGELVYVHERSFADTGNDQIVIDVSSLSNGTYFISFDDTKLKFVVTR